MRKRVIKHVLKLAGSPGTKTKSTLETDNVMFDPASTKLFQGIFAVAVDKQKLKDKINANSGPRPLYLVQQILPEGHTESPDPPKLH